MSLFYIHIRNSDYWTRDEGNEYESPAAALAVGVQSAAAIATDEIGKGHGSAALEVSVELADGARLLNSVVTLSVSPLLVAEPT